MNINIRDIFLKETIFSESVIDIILDYKKQIDKKDIFDIYFNNILKYGIKCFDNPKYFVKDDTIINLHEFIYYVTFHITDDKIKNFIENLNFKVNLMYVDSCDYYNFTEIDEIFYLKTFNIDEFKNLLPFKYSYIHIIRTLINNNIIYSKVTPYCINIKVEDPYYERVFCKKHKKIKFFKKILWHVKKIFK